MISAAVVLFDEPFGWLAWSEAREAVGLSALAIGTALALVVEPIDMGDALRDR